MVRSSSYRSPNYQGGYSKNQEQNQEVKEQFFSRQNFISNPVTSTPFFQTKLSIGRPHDKYEKEADHVADKIVNQKNSGPLIQQKEISSLQRPTTVRDDEQHGTNDSRFLRDKEIQEKPDIQRMCSDCEKESEDAKIHRSLQQEDKDIQEKSASRNVQNAVSNNATIVSHGLNNSKGNGSSMPQKTVDKMSTAFNTDFSNVKIHTGSRAIAMSNALGAQAFTHKNDIFFNAGKYDPGTSSGQHLLAHELTHVVQQGAADTHDVIQPYRPASSFNFGRKDSTDLQEENFSIKKDQTKKAWIEKIFIHFDKIKLDTDGDWMPDGTLFAYYHPNAVAPMFSAGMLRLPMFIAFPVTGGKHTELYTHPGDHTVTRIEGVGYSNETLKENEGPNKRYVKDLNSNMSFAIFFHRGEAIHRGGLDIGSHGCVHVDWGGAHDDGSTEQLRRLNYHSVIGLTKVIVTYNDTILPFLCCKRYAHKKKKKGVGDKPCHKVKAEACTP